MAYLSKYIFFLSCGVLILKFLCSWVICCITRGDLDEEIYMKQPEGFTVKGKKELVCKLKKSLYDLK